MATEFVMPKLGLTMEEGTITEWLVDDGVSVTAGTPILRVETDKTETDVEASGDGLLHQAAHPGETFLCGAVVGWFLAGDETPPSSSATPGAPAPAIAPVAAVAAPAPTPSRPGSNGRIFVSPNARRVAAERGVPLASLAGTGPNGRIVSEDVESWVPAAASPTVAAPAAAWAGAAAQPGLTLATHAARQFADLLGVDLAGVPVDPLVGRVSRDSVAAHVRGLLAQLAQPAAGARAQQPPQLVPLLQEASGITPMKGMRGTIARRMHESLTDMAQLSLFMDADLDAVVADRKQRAESGVAPGYTDYVIAAVARALRLHPVVNSQITEDGVALLPAVHISMAVALEDGLMVPVITDTINHSLETLSAETSRLASACRDGSIGLVEMEGGTFSVSTLGMFGVDGFTPVINPPNTAILGVGRLRDELVLGVDGTVSTSKRMTLSLTWDHRAFDGAPAAAFTQTIVELLNDPGRLDS